MGSRQMIDAIIKAVEYIEDHIHESITVNEVAGATGYSQFYFSRQFTKYTHMSLYDYIIRRKLSKASDLLMKRSVTEVAFEMGFNSHEHFTRCYKKYFGIVPSERQSEHIKRIAPLSVEDLHDDLLMKEPIKNQIQFEPYELGSDTLYCLERGLICASVKGNITEQGLIKMDVVTYEWINCKNIFHYYGIHYYHNDKVYIVIDKDNRLHIKSSIY